MPKLPPMSDPVLKPHQYWIRPANGQATFLADYTEFFEGCAREQLPLRLHRLCRSDIVARPRLAADFVAIMLKTAPYHGSHQNALATWRNVFRFLEDRTDLPHVESIADFNEIHGESFKQWLFDAGLTQSGYRRFKAIVDAYFLDRFQRPSPLAARDKDQLTDVAEPDLVALQRLSLVLRHEARAQIQMMSEGAALG